MKTTDLKKRLLQAMPYILMGLLGTNLGEAWRTAGGIDAAEKIRGFIFALPTAFRNPLPSLYPFDLLIGLLSAGLIRLIVYAKGKNAKKYRHNIEYGSARWGTAADIAPFMDSKFGNNLLLTKTERLTMNGRPADPKNARNKNVLVIGGSGSGKTRFFLTPNILQGFGSIVVTDPKGDLINNVGWFLQHKAKCKVRVFNTISFAKSMHYNPIAYVHGEKDVLKLVTVLMANTKGEGKTGSSDPFWDNAERLLLTALISFICEEAREEEKNFAMLLKMLSAMRVEEDDSDYKNAVDLLFEDLEKRKPESFAVRQFKLYKLAAGKTAKSILISAGARLAPFDIEEIREITAYDELELDKLGDRKTALFLIMSDTDSSFNFLIAMIYSQMFNLLCEKADDKYGGHLPVHVRCLIDEAANIGQIPNLEKLIATIRSREISACIILQTKSQLKALYKDNAETIIGNCDSQLFLGGTETTTLKDLSQGLGKETIDMYNTGENRGSQQSYSLNYSKTGHELMSIDELAVMDGGKCILQLRGVRPFLSDKYDLTQHPNYRYLAEASDKNKFNIEGYLSTHMKVRPKEQYTLYDIGTITEEEEQAS